MKSKITALLIVTGIYIVAIAAGMGVVFGLQGLMHPIWVLLIADVVATVVVFIASLFAKNASVYDPYWSVAPPILVVGFYLTTGAVFSPWHLFVIVPLCIWAVRLTWNWAQGFTDLKWQDWRYVDFKTKYPRIYLLINFGGIMMVPTLVVFACMVPFYYAITGAVSIVALACGGAVILFATIYQTVADAQKHKFLRNPNNKGKCIDSGLWKFSRHPNYFGEIMVWWGVFIGTVGNFNVYSIIGVILVTLLFFFISLPLIERHMMKSRPTEFAKYKKHVKSAIIPLPWWGKDKTSP